MGGGIREQNERARECGRCDRILHALLSNTGECIYGKEEIHAAETHERLRVGTDPNLLWGILRVKRLTRRGANGASFSNKDGSAFRTVTKP
jgi:hypothetical protein